MKRLLVFASGISVLAASTFAQTPGTPSAAPARPTGTISGFAPGAVSGFSSSPVSGFTPGAAGGFTATPLRGLSSSNTFAPSTVNPLTTTVGGFGTTNNAVVAPVNPNLIVTPVTPVVPVTPADSNRVLFTPLF